MVKWGRCLAGWIEEKKVEWRQQVGGRSGAVPPALWPPLGDGRDGWMKTSEEDGWVERWTSGWMESGAAEQRRLLPSCVRSVCLCGVCGRLTGGWEAGL